VLSEIDLALFLNDARLLAENARFRLHLIRHFPKHLRTCPKKSDYSASPTGLDVRSRGTFRPEGHLEASDWHIDGGASTRCHPRFGGVLDAQKREFSILVWDR
jgi:hypothetical protein